MQHKLILTTCALALAMLAPTSHAVSISAETRVCNGLVGSAESPRAACNFGNASGGGAVLLGGSGAGSGINYPFTDQNGTEFSATAVALQDYGIFRGLAQVHVLEQNPNLFGGTYAANAFGTSNETLTIGGGTGIARLLLSFTVTGNATGNLFVTDGHGAETAAANLGIGVSINSVFGGAVSVSTAGTYALNLNGPNAMLFTFGVPFDLQIVHSISVGAGYDRLHPPTFFQADANASFEHTSLLTGIAATDLFGNPFSAITINAASGTLYPLLPGPDPVPLPAALWLLISGVSTLGLRGRRATYG